MPLDDTNFPQTPEVDETIALLIRARGFIERGWCRNVFARNADGMDVDPSSERAVEWCANGALMAAGLSPAIARHPAIHRLAVAIADERIVCCSDGDRIARFNNGQETVEPVLAAFDRAIAASKEPTP